MSITQVRMTRISTSWFVDYKLSIHCGEDKTESILFSKKSKIKKGSKVRYYLQQYSNKTTFPSHLLGLYYYANSVWGNLM